MPTGDFPRNYSEVLGKTDAQDLADARAEIERLRAQCEAIAQQNEILMVELRGHGIGDGRVTQQFEAEIGRLRAALRVNALRWGYSDKEIDAILDDQQTAADLPKMGRIEPKSGS